MQTRPAKRSAVHVGLLLLAIGLTPVLGQDGEILAGSACTNASICVHSTTCQSAGPDSDEMVCAHKPLLPLNGADWAAMILSFFSTALAAGGGIGGGGLLVPIFILVSNFPSSQATALSLATISGGSLANLFTYAQRYHPNEELKRPLIDYDASLLFSPALLAGTMFGSMFSVMFPQWLVVVLLVLLLGYSAWKTLKKGIEKWNQQSKKTADIEMSSPHEGSVMDTSVTDDDEKTAAPESVEPVVEEKALEADSRQVSGIDRVQSICRSELDSTDPELKQMYIEEETLRPVAKFAKTFGVWVVVLVIALLRGGRGAESVIGAGCGTALYWVLFVIALIALGLITVRLRYELMTRFEKKLELGHVPVEGDLVWSHRSTIVYPCICIVAGVAAGLLGIGGGMVLGPLLVALGCLPQPVAATSAYVVLITATSGLVQVIIFGLLPYDYAGVFAVLGLVSTFVGQTAVDYVVKKYKKDAIVVLVIGLIMVIALILMTYAGIVRVINGANFGFNSLC